MKLSKIEIKLTHQYSFLSQKSPYLFLLYIVFSILSKPAKAQTKNISEKNIKFIEYPGFSGAHSTWDDIGYNPKYNTVYIGVTNHVDSVGIYEYNISKNEMKLKGFIGDLANLRAFQWQGKIHSKFIPDNEGNMYFSTDGGDYRQLDFMNGPNGYSGGYVMKWNPDKDKLTNLGMGLQYESLKDMDIDPETGIVYAVTFPKVHFLVYNPKTNNLLDLGRLGSPHVPRVLFTDQWGNCYYVDWRQRLVKYEKSEKKLVFGKEGLPVFPGTPSYSVVTGITAYAENRAQGIIYLITYGSKVLAFYPQKDGIGKVEDLGGVFDATGKEKWDYYVPNLNIGNNGKLYYFIGGHGNFAIKDTTVLVEFDPYSRKKRILIEYPTAILAEATGSNVKDEKGNLYFAARKEDSLGNSKPYMIKFNPEREVK